MLGSPRCTCSWPMPTSRRSRLTRRRKRPPRPPSKRDSRLAEGYAAKAIAEFCTDWNWSAADRDFSRALELNPNSVTSLFFRGTYLYFSGRPEQGQADLDRAARLDPLSPLPPFFQEFGSYVNGRYRDVIELHRKTQAIDPSFVYIDSCSSLMSSLST